MGGWERVLGHARSTDPWPMHSLVICFSTDPSFVSFHTAGHCKRVCVQSSMRPNYQASISLIACVWVSVLSMRVQWSLWKPDPLRVRRDRVKISVFMWIVEWMRVWMETHSPLTCQISSQQLFNWSGKGQLCFFPHWGIHTWPLLVSGWLLGVVFFFILFSCIYQSHHSTVTLFFC